MTLFPTWTFPTIPILPFTPRSSFSQHEEAWVADKLFSGVPEHRPIVIHPDAIFDFTRWTRFGRRLAIENMDRRKPIGRTVCELSVVYEKLPDASLCFDVGHARQYDASMTEAFLILSRFRDKLIEGHISEVNSASQHDAIFHGAKIAFQQIACMIPEWIPEIIESQVAPSRIVTKAVRVIEALQPARFA